MKKVFLGIISLLISTFIFCAPAYAGVNDFVIKDFQADFYLNKDSEGRSTLKTIEVITAEFPEINQNHGIERAIPQKYNDHKVSLNIVSITDENNKPYNYSESTSNDNLVLRIGDADKYVHGFVTYKITYELRDVTHYFADTNSDEFYWDVNGVGWSQVFEKVTARLHINSNLVESLTGNQQCYYGGQGANNKCEISKVDDYYMAEVANIGFGENVTIAFGFKGKTFNPYQESSMEKLFRIATTVYFVLCAVAILVIIILLIKAIYLASTKGKGYKGSGIIIPEYLPPKGIETMLSARIMKLEQQWVPAFLVDLAVRKNIKIIEKKEGIFKKTVYSLEYVSSDNLSELEIEAVNSIFNVINFAENASIGNLVDGLISAVANKINDASKTPAVGAIRKLDTSKPDYTLASHLRSLYAKTETSAKQHGFYEENNEFSKKIGKIITTMIILTIFSAFSVIGIFVGVISISIAGVLKYTVKPLSQKGRELSNYLEGLKMYIKVAESDRLKILQSPSGAERISIDVNDKTAVLKLYEKILPYAVMFGMGKEWSRVLGDLYVQQNTSPDWYSGSSAFNSIAFGAAMASFSTSTSASSYSSPSSSSSSGGSSGGGFSGGGGGGGGGGGW